MSHFVIDHRSSVLRLSFALLASLVLGGCVQPQRGNPKFADVRGKHAPRGAMWIDALDLSVIEQEWGSAEAARSVGKKPLTIKGETFAHGVGTHANSEFVIELGRSAQRFEAAVGVDDESGQKGSVVFTVTVDGKEVSRTPVIRGGDEATLLSVDLRGASQLILAVEDGGDGIDSDHADWAGAMIVLAPGAKGRPQAVRYPEEPMPIAMTTPPEPAIHAPHVTGGTPGRPFVFRIPASGDAPMYFEADGLPEGLTLDSNTGVISGVLSRQGTHEVRLRVQNFAGETGGVLRIVAEPKSLALTPPMGWNSWNVWGTAVDDPKVRDAADWMVRSGLAAHGFQYINIDDAWEGKRDAEGRIQTNEKFPDMKALADYVHAKGLRLGIYSSPGRKTCAGYEGSYEHEVLDAQQWAAWGIDLIKYDWCSYNDIAKDHSVPELRKPYEVMRRALDECGRDIVYSLCQYGMGKVSEWGAQVGGNYWRTTDDITDTWVSMSKIGFGQSGLEPFAGPGHWNDPDMLVVGRLGWGPKIRPTKLTHNEQITHITLWSLLAAPLLIGCDLSQLDDFTRALLTNPEVLEVSQDTLGQQARRVSASGKVEVWARPLSDGSVAVGLFNRGRTPAPVTVHWSELGINGSRRVRNLWQRRDEGRATDSFSATVQRHGAMLIRLSMS